MHVRLEQLLESDHQQAENFMKDSKKRVLKQMNLAIRYKLEKKAFNLTEFSHYNVNNKIYLRYVEEIQFQAVSQVITQLFLLMVKLVVVKHILWGQGVQMACWRTKSVLFREFSSLYSMNQIEKRSYPHSQNSLLKFLFWSFTMKNCMIYLIQLQLEV